MTKKELKAVSKFLSPKIGQSILDLEKEIDNYFINKKRHNKREYQIVKKKVTTILINEAIPFIVSRVSQSLVNLWAEAVKNREEGATKNINKKKPTKS